MPDLYPVQNNFTSGEISPNLYGRRELAAYANALQTCQNVIPQPQGGAFGRGAFTWLFDGLTGGYGQNVRLIPFVFNQNILNSYLIEIGFSSVTSKSYINIYSAYGTPAQVGSTITTTDTGADLPWNQAAGADIPNLDYCQINDILYIVDGRNPLYKLVRSGTSAPYTWTVSVASLISENLIVSQNLEYRLPSSAFNFTIFATKGVIDSLIDGDSRYVIETRRGNHSADTYPFSWGTAGVYHAVPSYITDMIASIGATDSWGWGIDARIWIPNNGATRWYFAINTNQGYLQVSGRRASTGNILNTLATRYTNHTPFNEDETEYQDNDYLIAGTGGITAANLHTGAFNAIRLRMITSADTAVYGVACAWRDDGDVIAGGTYTGRPAPVISHVDWNGNNCYQIRVTITTGGLPAVAKFSVEIQEQLTIDNPNTFDSYTTLDTNQSVNGFTSAGTKYQVSLAAPVGNIGRFYFTQTGTCTLGDVWTFKFGWIPIKNADVQRREETSSDTTELFPKHLTFYEGRLWLCGFDVAPFRIIGSRSGQLENFSVTEQSLDTDAVDITIMKDQSNPIVGATSNAQGLIILTANGIAVVNGGNDAITPSKTQVKFHSSLRAAEVRPISVDNAILFVEAGKKNIQKILYDSIGESFAPDNVTLLCDHLTINRIFEMVFTPSFITKGTTVTTAPAIKVLWFIEGTSTDVNRKLRSITLEDAHKVRAAAKHTVCSDSEVLSICALPSSTGGDDLYALIRSTAKSKNIITKYDPTTYADTLSATGSTLNYTQRIETLPPEIELPFGTSRAFKKRWVDAHLTLKNTSNLTVLPLWIYDTVSLAQSVGVSGTVEDANYKILGWDKNAQLRIQQTTGASMEVLALHGKLAVSIK